MTWFGGCTVANVLPRTPLLAVVRNMIGNKVGRYIFTRTCVVFFSRVLHHVMSGRLFGEGRPAVPFTSPLGPLPQDCRHGPPVDRPGHGGTAGRAKAAEGRGRPITSRFIFERTVRPLYHTGGIGGHNSQSSHSAKFFEITPRFRRKIGIKKD